MLNMPQNLSDHFVEYYKDSHQSLYQIAYNILQDAFLAEKALHWTFLRVASYEACRPSTNILEMEASQVKQIFSLLVWYVSSTLSDKKKAEARLPGKTGFVPSTKAADVVLSLPAVNSCIFLLKYNFNFDNKSIAVLLGLSNVSVWGNLRKAKQAISGLVS